MADFVQAITTKDDKVWITINARDSWRSDRLGTVVGHTPRFFDVDISGISGGPYRFRKSDGWVHEKDEAALYCESSAQDDENETD